MDFSMIISTIELRKLTPDEGMVLTNGEAYATGEMYLGCNDSPENWHEITTEEYEAVMAEKEVDDIEDI